MSGVTGMEGAPKPPPTVIRQDGPPPGGYKPPDYAKKVPSMRPRNAMFWFAATALWSVVAFYPQSNWKKKVAAIENEYVEMNHYLKPYLQAEEDELERVLRKKRIEEEKKIMHDVHGWDYDDNMFITRGSAFKRQIPLQYENLE